MKKAAIQTLFYLGLLGLWQAVAAAEFWPAYLFPSPVQVARTLVTGFADHEFLSAILHSLRRIAIGYGLSVVGGLMLGFLLSRNVWVENTVGSLVLGLQTLPSICWLPAALLWFGLSDAAIIFVVLISSLLSITIATDDGVKNLPPIYVRAARTMGARGWRLYQDVIFPAALPSILTGLKQGWSFAWRSLLAGELLFVSAGLGHILQMGRELNDISQVFAVMLIIVALGLAVDRGAFSPLERKIRSRWGMR